MAYDQTRHKVCVMQRRDGGDGDDGGDAHLDASGRAAHRNKHAWPRDNKISCCIYEATRGEQMHTSRLLAY